MITIAQDGTGDFGTVAAALDFVESTKMQSAVLFIRKGIYRERLEMRTPGVTLLGEDAEATVLTGGLYAKMPAEDGLKLGTFRSYSLFIDADDVCFKSLTIENSAGPGSLAGQAIALYADGDRLVFEGCRLLGWQDTLFTAPLPPKEIEKNGFIGPKQYAPRINGRHLYKNCFISGDVDFIFGGATAYFEGCEIFCRTRDGEAEGYVTAASTPEGQAYGYVFSGCRFTSDAPEHTFYLGRPWRDNAQTVILNSWLGSHIRPEGWHDWNKPQAHALCFYAEYNNDGPGAALSQRPGWVHRLTPEEALRYAKARVLAGDDGWSPD